MDQDILRQEGQDREHEARAGTHYGVTFPGVVVQRAARGVQGVVIVVERVSQLTLEMGEGEVKRAELDKAGLKIDLKIAWQK